MSESMQSSLRELSNALTDYTDLHETSDGALPGKPVGTKHPLYKAMQAFEKHLPGKKLPTSAWGAWVRFLRASRNRDVLACELAHELHLCLRKTFLEFLNDLTETERHILEAIGDDTLNGPKVAKKSGYGLDTVKHHLSNLVKREILVHVGGQGYRRAR